MRHRHHSGDADDRARERYMAERDRRAGPSPSDVADALAAVAEHDIPGTPPLAALRTLREAVGTPITVGDRRIKSFSVARGRPMDGAARSDDHVSGYEVEFTSPDACPECDGFRRLYRYSACHFIAGSESTFCLDCEEKLDGEEW